ncbi:MAG: DUF3488 and transglutaminase-like domain-containing protein, partial [Herbiconiux sp.]|nr:DUF3488 and transglutaminase-like domain-containing protein [Herbiconiux sp.]
WRVTALVAVLFGVALFALSPLLQGVGWWFAAGATVLLLLAVTAFMRALGLPELVVMAIGAVVWAALVVLLYASDTLLLIIPTSATFGDLAGDLGDAGLSIAVQEVPAVADGPITQLLVMAVGLLAIVADGLAAGLRSPVLAATAPLSLLAVAPIVRRSDPDVVVYVLLAVVLFALLWTSTRLTRRDRSLPLRPAGLNPALALGTAAAAIAAMVVLPAVTPGLTARSLTDSAANNAFPSVYSAGVDPTIQLGRDLRRSSPVLSLSYTTSSDEGLYLKMVNLGDFSSGTWVPEEPLNAVGYDGQAFGSPPGLAPDVPVTDISTSVSIAALNSDWLPLPYPTQEVDALEGSWLLTPSSFTVTDLTGDTRGLEYSATSLAIAPTPDQLAAAGSVVPDALRSFLLVPEGLDPIIADTAAAVTSGAATNYDRAVALQEYFRSDQFTYSLQAPVDGEFDDDNAAALADFLRVKQGYCVHFSASMAVMARTLGIPSRIAVGYAPAQTADRTSEGGALYEVFTDQLHAWPELYFEGIGWLPFEPTPGLDITPPDYSLPDYAQSGASGALDDTPSGATPTAAADPERDALDITDAQSAEQAALGQLRGWASFAAVLGGVAVVGLTPLVLRRLRRRSRIRSLRTAPRPATAAWTEFEDTLDDYRVQRSAGDSPHELVRRLDDEIALPPE